MTDRDSCISGKSAVDELGNIRVDLGTFNHAEDSSGHIEGQEKMPQIGFFSRTNMHVDSICTYADTYCTYKM